MNIKTIRRVFLILVISFALIFLLRLWYELASHSSAAGSGSRTPAMQREINYWSGTGYSDMSSLSGKTQNVATAKQTIADGGGTEVRYDQKYEMVSRMTANTGTFEDDEKLLRHTISSFNGVVQMENSSGLEGFRTLWISAGIVPSSFDALVESLKETGSLTSFSVNKTDKTDEYRTLLSRREFLGNTRDAYASLKSRGGDMADLITLEEKIIETEELIMETGVSLGLFDESLSLCTVEFTLSEQGEEVRTGMSFAAFMRYASDALGWTVIFYISTLAVIIASGFACLGIVF